MRRRGLLSLVSTGISIAVAGCGGGNASDDGAGPGPAAPPIDEAIELLDHELRRMDHDTFAESVGVTGRAKNTSDVDVPSVQFRVTFRDEDGDDLHETVSDGRDVSAKEAWSFEVEFNGTGSSARAVADYDIEVDGGSDE